MSAIHAAGVEKSFGPVPALRGIDLELAPGEVRGLLGPNGAGKTTLLRILFGLLRPDAGQIEVLGQTVQAPLRVPLAGVGGFVEEPSFYPYFSARGNLELLRDLDRADGEVSVDVALEVVGLTDAATRRVGGFSTGMRQRLGIASALLRSPRLLLLDEPTSGLDPAAARAVATLIGELSARGVAVLLSSHLIGELEAICDSYTVIRDGHVVWDGSAAELRRAAPAAAYRLETSDDDRACAIAARCPGVRSGTARRGGLAITVEPGRLDPFVLELGRAEVAVRRLEMLITPLESMYFALTGETVGTDPVVTPTAVPAPTGVGS